MVETSRDWSEKLPFALWAYRTSFRTSTGATPYSLVYGMEAVLPIEIEMGSLRVALEQQIPEADWAQARFDQLNLLDERRLRAADHVRAYQRKMTHAFKKRVRPRPLQIDDLVLKVIRGLIRDPRGKFKPNWSGPYFIRELTPEGAAWLMDLDGNRFSESTNVDQLKSFLSFLSPYHLGLRYVPCLKTTLRPWDQMSSSAASTWTEPSSLLSLAFSAIIVLSFGIQSHHRFSVSAFRAITIFSLAFRAFITSQFWRLEPSSPLSFGIHSHHYFQFGVQSLHHFSVLAFGAIIASQFWHS
ncbi:hypothetical protein VitviT2T_020468 [Vitis vinifera]|uniref:Gypsy retrotransposon integrase-like protein 1 n=1 Tax=Vitis vinifera TaxID=29760 RepID=A0ABY9D4H2_VITVI|nr:hypothetical protein VitviT2T_020468 [Vitis vinifera]